MTEVPRHVAEWAQRRASHRAAGDFAAADALREKINGAGFDVRDTSAGPVVTPARRFTPVDPAEVADLRDHPDTVDVSVLLLLDAFGLDGEPDWLVGDASRCLASVLAACQGRSYEVVVLDNGVGGNAGAWAADVARNPGSTVVHLAEAVGFAAARGLQHRLATGSVVLWLDCGVELTGDVVAPLCAAFADPTVGAVGRWGADVGTSVHEFAAVEPPPAACATWTRCGAICSRCAASWCAPARWSSTTGSASTATPMPTSRSARAARARFCRFCPRSSTCTAGTARPAEVVERESRRNYRRLLERWRPELERRVRA